MRLLILSDLHANLTAFDAVLAAASGKWDAAVCLGDVVGYGPDPATVSEKLQTITSDVIRGNHDKAVAGIMTSDDFNPVAKMAVEWTQSQLSPELMSWLSTLPPGPKKAQGVVLIHGAFQDEDEYVFTPAQALEGLLDSGQGFFVNAEKKLFSGRSRENFVEENSQAVIWNRFEAEWRLAHFTDAFADSHITRVISKFSHCGQDQWSRFRHCIWSPTTNIY